MTTDVEQAVNENVAVRFNAFYENTDSYRDFVNLERHAFNPTVTFAPNDTTTVKLGYEYLHDVYPGGPVNAAGTSVNLTAYNNETDRQNIFNQTDLTWPQLSLPAFRARLRAALMTMQALPCSVPCMPCNDMA